MACLDEGRPQSIDKASGKEVLIRNDGVYVISGIFCGAHEARAL